MSTITQVSLFWHPQTDNLFPIFHVPFTVLFTLYFHTVISVFCTSIYAVFVIDRTRKQTLFKLFNFVFTKDLQSISQSIIQAVKAEKEEYYTLSNIIYIKLKNCCSFFFEVYFEAPKMYTNQLNNICKGVATELQYLQLYQRYASIQVLFNIFSQICSVVICKKISEILRTFVSQKPFE